MSDLNKRVSQYINSENSCPVARSLIIELQKCLKAANRGAEMNMQALMHCVKMKKIIEDSVKNQTPLGSEFEAVWNENIDTLYQT